MRTLLGYSFLLILMSMLAVVLVKWRDHQVSHATLGPDEFASLVSKAIQGSDYSNEFSYDPQRFAFDLGAGRWWYLENAYEEYRRARPENRDPILSKYIRQLKSLGEDSPDFASVQKTLLPVVRERLYFDFGVLDAEGRGETVLKRVYEPITNFLYAGLGIDTETATTIISQHHLDKWGMTSTRS